jgi:hypothetical protein
MNAAATTHYSQLLQPPTATAGERVMRPLLPLPLPTTTTMTINDEEDDDNDADAAADKAANAPNNARYSPR